MARDEVWHSYNAAAISHFVGAHAAKPFVVIEEAIGHHFRPAILREHLRDDQERRAQRLEVALIRDPAIRAPARIGPREACKELSTQNGIHVHENGDQHADIENRGEHVDDGQDEVAEASELPGYAHDEQDA